MYQSKKTNVKDSLGGQEAERGKGDSTENTEASNRVKEDNQEMNPWEVSKKGGMEGSLEGETWLTIILQNIEKDNDS